MPLAWILTIYFLLLAIYKGPKDPLIGTLFLILGLLMYWIYLRFSENPE